MDTEDSVALKDNHGFPLVVAHKGDVPNLASVAAKKVGRHDFGVDPDGCAAALRLLADQIVRGNVIPQEMEDATKASVGDFAFRTLTFTFAVKLDPEA